MSLAELMDIIEEEDFDVTLSGGDPLYHPREIEVLIREIVKTGHTVWLFTGFTWEEILRDENKFRCVSAAEAVVDGPFIKELRDADLQFRGSSNQRIINVRESLDQGNTVLF